MEVGGRCSNDDRMASVNFQRNRVEYIRGFGNLAGEHWLGLEKIHRLTKWVDFEPELRVNQMDFNNYTAFEQCNKFYVNSPPSYTLYATDASGSAGKWQRVLHC